MGDGHEGGWEGRFGCRCSSLNVCTVGMVVADERVSEKKPSSPVAGLGRREYVEIGVYWGGGT